MKGISLPLIIFLSACSAHITPPQIVTKYQYIEKQIPVEFLSCYAAPPVPAITTQDQVARYVVNLWVAGQDCRNKIYALAEWANPSADFTK